MERVKINLPARFLFSYQFTIEAADINEANHMGNERILVYANSIRAKMFDGLQLKLNDEINGYGTIVANHSIHYKSEGFLGDVITCHAGVNNITECSFDLIFQFLKNNDRTLALLRTGCVYYEYEQRKIRPLPEDFIHTFTANLKSD